MKILVFIFAILALVHGQIISEGDCPKVDAIKDFDIEKYVGQWYEIHRYENEFQKGGDCVKATYEIQPDETVKVTNSMIVDGKEETKNGIATFAGNSTEGKLIVDFGGTPGTEPNYWILETDYIHHALVYSCTNIPNSLNKKVFTWILSRTRTLPATSVVALVPFVKQAELFWENYRLTTQVCDITPKTPEFQSILGKFVSKNEKLVKN